MLRRLPTACAACALALATVTPSRADETWVGTTSNDWFDAHNWFLPLVPTSTDNVTIDTVNPNATVVGAAGAVANSLTVGVFATGTLTIQNGGTVSNVGFAGDIGQNTGSTGAVTVTGVGSSWTTGSNGFSGLTVGDFGTGTLTIQNGGTVSNAADGLIAFNPGSTGTVTVDGAGSSWTISSGLSVGAGGTGTLTIQNGGMVSSGAGGGIGTAPTATGTVTVTGAGSSWTINSFGLVVGLSGTGTLTIQNGGTVSSSGGGDIGVNSGSTGTVTVTGAGSTWTNSGSFTVGAFGSGRLTIQNGGTVSTGGSFIGQNFGGTGTVTVTGAGSSWTTNSGRLAVGDNGAGTLTIQNGGRVSSGGGGTIGEGSGSTGTVTVTGAGSSWTINSGLFFIGNSGTGTLTIQNGGTVNTGSAVTIIAGSAGSTGTLNIGAASGQPAAAPGTLNTSLVGLGRTGRIVFNHTASSYAFAPTILGAGSVRVEAGTTILTGISNNYTGATTINGGTLEVDGSIANSSGVTVAAGGTLSGTGAVGPTTIMSGGTLAPGNPTRPTGALTITGNLAFQPGALYLIGVNPTSAGAANVSGTASLAGNVLAAFAPGSYGVRQYDILHSAGLGGTTFGGLGTVNLPAGFTASLSYTSTDVLLNPVSQLGSTGGLNGNQQAVANSLNNFFNGGGTLPPSFLTIFGLTGGNQANALSQLSGEAAADGQKGAFDLMTQFLGVMTDPHLGGPGGTAVLLFASEADLPPEIALAYARALKAPGLVAKAPPSPAEWGRGWSVWGSGFGGANKTAGDAVVGSHDVTARDAGFAAGADYRVAPDTLVGFALAGADTHWDLAQGLAGGRSDAFQAGVYGRRYFGGAYVAGAAAFANHWMQTNRVAPLGDQLAASFNAQVFGGRLEAGERFALPAAGIMIGVTPYGALQAQSFHAGAYSESDLSGGGFALNHNAMNASDTRSELGARFDDLTMLSGMPLVLRSRLAWAHDWVSNPAIGAVFQALPGAAFTVNGAAPPKDSSLTTAGFELRPAPNWSLGAKFEGEFAPRSQTYAGTGTLRYTW